MIQPIVHNEPKGADFRVSLGSKMPTHQRWTEAFQCLMVEFLSNSSLRMQKLSGQCWMGMILGVAFHLIRGILVFIECRCETIDEWKIDGLNPIDRYCSVDMLVRGAWSFHQMPTLICIPQTRICSHTLLIIMCLNTYYMRRLVGVKVSYEIQVTSHP